MLRIGGDLATQLEPLPGRLRLGVHTDYVVNGSMATGASPIAPKPADQRLGPQEGAPTHRWVGQIIVALRFVLVPMWVAAAVLAVVYLPSLGQGQGGAIGTELLPADAPALEAEVLSKTQFGVPFVGRTVVVHHDDAGLAPGSMGQAVQTARDVQDGRFPDLPGLAAAIPVPNTVHEPGSASTTILYVLHFWPGTGSAESVEVARHFAAEYVPAGPGEFVGVTGTVPATAARAAVIQDWLMPVTLATRGGTHRRCLDVRSGD